MGETLDAVAITRFVENLGVLAGLLRLLRTLLFRLVGFPDPRRRRGRCGLLLGRRLFVL
jgi:hypothetical protein